MKRTVWNHKRIREGIRLLGTAAFLAACLFAGRQAAVLVTGLRVRVERQESRGPY